MVDFERNEVSLIDFGLASFFETTRQKETPTTDFCGSMEYLAPEVLRGLPYSASRSDAWSLGVTAYTLLFGVFPFSAEEMLAGKGHPYPPHVQSVPLPQSPLVSDRMKKTLEGLLRLDSRTRSTVASLL